MSKMKRRDFIRNSAAAGIAIPAFPSILKQSAVKPMVIASANGNRFKNGGNVTAVQKAFQMITGGSDVLDAVIAGVNIVELDPLDDSVGFGGLPNADGVVQLDSSVMHGPKKQAGAVGALEGVRTPSLVARAVMDYTDHHLIVGKGAQDFARNMGFKIEDDLNTENSRKQWLEWKRRSDPGHYLDRSICSPKDSCAKRTCTARSTATALTREAISAVSPRQVDWHGRSPDDSAIHPFSVRVFMLTAQSVRPVRPDAAKRTCSISARL
jgi:hypothetical protein